MNLLYLHNLLTNKKINNLLDIGCGSSCVDYGMSEYIMKNVNKFHFFDYGFPYVEQVKYNYLTIRQIEEYYNVIYSRFFPDKFNSHTDFFTKEEAIQKFRKDKIKILTGEFNPDYKFDIKFDFIIMSQILHFYSHEEQSVMLKNVYENLLTDDGMLYIVSCKADSNPHTHKGAITASNFKKVFNIDTDFKIIDIPVSFEFDKPYVEVLLKKKI